VCLGDRALMVAEYSDRTVGSVVAEKGVNLYLN
jgi:hypothetical protein